MPSVSNFNKVNLQITIDVQLGIEVDGEYKWVEAEAVVNNGDGTVAITFKKLCPVAISVA